MFPESSATLEIKSHLHVSENLYFYYLFCSRSKQTSSLNGRVKHCMHFASILECTYFPGLLFV